MYLHMLCIFTLLTFLVLLKKCCCKSYTCTHGTVTYQYGPTCFYISVFSSTANTRIPYRHSSRVPLVGCTVSRIVKPSQTTHTVKPRYWQEIADGYISLIQYIKYVEISFNRNTDTFLVVLKCNGSSELVVGFIKKLNQSHSPTVHILFHSNLPAHFQFWAIRFIMQAS